MPPPVPHFDRARARTVLFVEDNPDHALLLELAATDLPPDVDLKVLPTGESALAYLDGRGEADATPPDLVVLDLLLPGLGGFDVLRWIRRQPRFSRLPVVVLTSSVNPGDLHRAVALGAAAFHSKPPVLTELRDVVRSIVDTWLP